MRRRRIIRRRRIRSMGRRRSFRPMRRGRRRGRRRGGFYPQVVGRRM